MRILPDETAGSLAFRLAQQRQQSVAALCRELFELNLVQARSDLDRRLASDHSAALARASQSHRHAVLRLGLPDRFTNSVWCRETRRYTSSIRACPVCLAECKYGRRFWRTCFAASCPIHGTELLSRCPHCNVGLPYFGEMAGIVTQFWLESWPTCPTCLRLIESTHSAHPVLTTLSRRWMSALSGRPLCGYRAGEFLRLSARILAKFTTVDRYQRLAELVAPHSNWPHHVATALLLRALLRSRTPMNVGYAALGVDFQPDQLAKDIVV